MAETTYAQYAEQAELDFEAREALSRFDRLSKLSNEVEIGVGFQAVDPTADPTTTPVETDEDPEIRHVADFWIRNHWSPEAAAEVAAERAAANRVAELGLGEVA